MALLAMDTVTSKAPVWAADALEAWEIMELDSDVAPLYFPVDLWGVVTPFRQSVLTRIFQTAWRLSEGLLVSGVVWSARAPDEENSLHLNLTMTVDSSWETADGLHDQILEWLADWSQYWSEDERDDYSRWIYFGVAPAHP